jgi:large subunit ribosomal protein L12
MEYVYTAMLLHTTGQEINEENVNKVLKAAEAEVNDARVKALIAALEDVDIDEAIEKTALTAAAPAAASATTAEKAPEEEEEEEEEESEEEKEEEAAAGLGALFG